MNEGVFHSALPLPRPKAASQQIPPFVIRNSYFVALFNNQTIKQSNNPTILRYISEIITGAPFGRSSSSSLRSRGLNDAPSVFQMERTEAGTS